MVVRNKSTGRVYYTERQKLQNIQMDLKRGFRQIKVDPNDIPWLVFQVDSEFYSHSVLPFGRRLCVRCCQRNTKAAVFILKQEDILVDVYINDFFSA